MPELYVGDRHWSVAMGSNLLDSLNQGGLGIPFSCRAGSCHACLVKCVQGEPEDALPQALDPGKRTQGWRLACQCRVVEDLTVQAFDPLRDGLPAQVVGTDWLSPTVLRLRLEPERPLRYRAGQHVVLWTDSGVARTYSLASLPSEDRYLEFHIDCRQPGAFTDVARVLRIGDRIGLGELRGGALHYDPDWQERPLLLLAAGTGLGPIWAIVREALRQEHLGPIRLVHVARDHSEHYLRAGLATLVDVLVQQVVPEELDACLADLRMLSRKTIALLCGSPSSVEAFAKRLYLAGVPRNQVLADMFLGAGTGREAC
jgi:NAD(P)H-flavin reductase/ferredoxin